MTQIKLFKRKNVVFWTSYVLEMDVKPEARGREVNVCLDWCILEALDVLMTQIKLFKRKNGFSTSYLLEMDVKPEARGREYPVYRRPTKISNTMFKFWNWTYDMETSSKENMYIIL
ncbi:hypothetical protein QE152_g22907 [Popillia japonica]|uniref:Uncharacterized protein n=1 Tax=Popillia japonica TaxID=7064 RepID=A0AAW1KJJ0_POPJA